MISANRRSDARQALAICNQYQFDQLGYVGHPTPSFKYLMKDPTPRPVSTVESIIPATAAMQANEMPHARLTLPGVGDIGDRVPFDGRRLDLRHEGGDWVLYAGRAVGRPFRVVRGSRCPAHDGNLQQFRVTELCRIGESGFGFFLSNGRPPRCSSWASGKALRTDTLNVRQVGGNWAVCEGSRQLVAFGDQADDARNALAAIREYRFDIVAPIGDGRLGNVYLFVKTRS